MFVHMQYTVMPCYGHVILLLCDREYCDTCRRSLVIHAWHMLGVLYYRVTFRTTCAMLTIAVRLLCKRGTIASRSQRVSLIVIPFCLSVCLSGCLLVIPHPTAYHDWSITTKFGRQVYTCPRTHVSLFGSPIFHTFGARVKYMQNFAYLQRQPFNAYSCHCERDASCHMTCVYCLCLWLFCMCPK